MKLRTACKLLNMSKRYYKKYSDWSDLDAARDNLYVFDFVEDADGNASWFATEEPHGRDINALKTLIRWKQREDDYRYYDGKTRRRKHFYA